MSTFELNIGTKFELSSNKQDQSITVDEIHSSFVFEELFSRFLTRFFNKENVKFKDSKIIGIDLCESHQKKTSLVHGYSDSEEKIILHEFSNDYFNYKQYLSLKDEKVKFSLFKKLIMEELVFVLKDYVSCDSITLKGLVIESLKLIEISNYKMEILISKTPKYNKKRNLMALLKVVITVEGAEFWVEFFEDGLKIFKSRLVREIASPNAFSLYFGKVKWESDTVFVINSEVRNWNVSINTEDFSVNYYKVDRN